MTKFVNYLLATIILLCCSNIFLTAQGRLNKGEAYKVVINHEEQYSIWPQNEDLPKGWETTRIKGNLKKCQEYIEEVWTDMRPLSIRKLSLPGNTEYKVVINHEVQYSIWPSNKKVPKGWKATNFSGDLKSCKNYIEEVWTDMRPLSIRIRK